MKPPMSYTIVTAFLRRANAKHTVDTYKSHFDRLVSCGVPIVLFLDRRYEWTFPDHVRVIPTSLDETWVASVVSEPVVLPTHRDAVDSKEYMIIITAKTELLSRATAENPFGTEWFAWVDFGIGHVFRDPDATFSRLRSLPLPVSPCIRTAGIWNWREPVLEDRICWRFAGGFMMCHASLAKALDRAVRESVLRRLPALTWEVNTWADVENHGLDLGWFQANHDDSIVPFTA
jgi:hypothetical protein